MADVKPRDIPAFPQSMPSDVLGPLTRMREAVQLLLGTRGDGRFAAFTAGRAAQLGLTEGVGGGPGPGLGGDGDVDLTPPPSVEGLAVGAGIAYLFVEWDVATYTQGHGHGGTNIYAVQKDVSDPTLPTFADAQKVYTAVGALTLAAIPSEPNTRWHVWVKWFTADGVESVSPAGGTNGLTVTTGQDVGHLLEVLQGQITGAELHATLGTRIDLIDACIGVPGSVNARVATEASTRATADNSLATSISLVAVTAGDAAAAVLTEASARAAADGTLFAQYTVKVDVNGYVSGFGLASTAAGAAPVSSFIVRADRFAISSPTGPGITPIVPFIVTTTPTVENGVSVPAGVYMDGAYIKNLTAAVARLGTAWIDNAMVANLSAAKLTVGDGTVGGNLRSTNYVAGSTGWMVRPDGYAEFSNVVARGTIFAAAGAIGGITIGATYLQSNTWVNGSAGFRFNSDGTGQVGGIAIGNDHIRSHNFVDGVSGFRLSADGSLQAQSAYIRGDVRATSIAAASGTLGTVTAGVLRNSTDSVSMNLNAVGSALLFRAGAISGGRYPVEIYADGSAFFTDLESTSIAASGNASLALPLRYQPPVEFAPWEEIDAVTYLDTGLNVSYADFTARTLSARARATSAYLDSLSYAAGQYALSVGLQVQPVLVRPLFAAGSANQSANPYGPFNTRVFLRVVARIQHLPSGPYYTQVYLTGFAWQLDWIA